MNKLFFALAITFFASPLRADTPAPYTLDDTEVHTLHAKALKRDYQVLISLPPSYKNSTRRYPVVFVTDAPYAFPVVRSMAKRMGDHGHGLEEFILVGLAYANGDTPEYSRRRDYTPVPTTDTGLESDMPGRKVLFGEAEGYRQFVAADVFALVASHYRADMRRKIFAGHSYGSLFGLHALFTDPAMFDQYILGSPSLWYAKRVMFEREKAYAANHKDLKAAIYFGVGSLEGKGKETMITDMKQFEALLKSRNYPGLHVQSRVFDDETHLTVAPAILTHGLPWVLAQAK